MVDRDTSNLIVTKHSLAGGVIWNVHEQGARTLSPAHIELRMRVAGST